MATYAIFTEWKRGDGSLRREATGAEESADSAGAACEKAHRRGIGWGLGRKPNYVGLVAVRVKG